MVRITLRRMMATMSIAAGLMSWSGAAQTPQSRRQPQILTYQGPPATLQEMVDSVPIIVLGKVEKSEQKLFGTEYPFPTVVHTIRINRTLKGPKDLKPKSALDVAQPGGVASRDGIEYSVDDRGFPVFVAGDEYLLFLKPDKFYGGLLTVEYGPTGAFPLTHKGSRAQIPQGAKNNIGQLSMKKDMEAAELAILIQTIVNKGKL